MDTTARQRYELRREVGGHGMVRIFDGVDTETGTPVTIKTMPVRRDEDLELLLRFQEEAAIISTLKHPNIWTMHCTFTEGGTSYIVLEQVEGLPLAEILTGGPLPLPRVKSLSAQIASVLVYAHGRGVIHRDLSPDEIVIQPNDHVKVRALMEMGMARMLRSGAVLATGTDLNLPPPRYMAPEQLAGRKVDGRADIYSVGAVMYHMVTGRPPYDGGDFATVAAQQARGAPQPPGRLRLSLPPDWDAVIMQALARDPENRIRTAVAMERAIEGLSGADRASRPPAPAQPPPVSVRCPKCGYPARGKFCSACGARVPTA